MSGEPSEVPSASGPLMPTRAFFLGKNIDTPSAGEKDVTAEVEREMPFDGVVSKMYLDIPSGVHSRAGFRIVDKERGVTKFPYDGQTDYASFDDVSGFWPVSFPLRKNDEIVVEYINEDTTTDVESHFLKVWLILVGIEALPYSLDDLAQREGVEL